MTLVARDGFESYGVPAIIPLGVFVARRRKFAVITPGNHSANAALDLAFRELPLEEFGWTRGRAYAKRASEPTGTAFDIWKGDT